MKKYFYLPVIIITLFISCKKEKDKQAPQVSILLPVENQSFYVNDDVPVKGNITDESILVKATVSLLNEQGQLVMPALTIPVSNTTEVFDLKFALNDIHLESGRYQLCIFATDGINDGYGYQWIYIQGIPRSLKKIMVTTGTSMQTNLSVVDSISTSLLAYQHFPGDHLASAANSYSQKFFHCGTTTGNFTGLDLNTNSVFFNEPPVASPPAPYFTGFGYFNNTCYVGFYKELIRGYDQAGAVIYNSRMRDGYYALRLCMNDGQLLTEEKHKITGDKTLVCYYETGVARQSVALDMDVSSFCEKNNTQVFVFGNKSAQGVIRLYDRLTNNLWEPYPYTLPMGSIISAIKLDSDTYLLAHSNGTVYKYVYSASSVTPFLTGYTAIQMMKDETSGILYVVEKNKINRFEYPSLKQLPVIHSSETILDVSLLYNR